MNILHMKYAVEVARLGSLNKAAESLFVAQPNIIRSIKELEDDLGIVIFSRSAKGMVLTPEGEEFINYAQRILKQIDEVELMYKQGTQKKQRFSISVPRAYYISEAFAEFSGEIQQGSAEIFYRETNSQQTINSVLNNDCSLGIIRYARDYDKYIKDMLDEKGLSYEMISEFLYVLIMHKDHMLAQKEEIMTSDLRPYIEISHADPDMPNLPIAKLVKEELTDTTDRHIFIFDRAVQFDLLIQNHETFMWVSPTSDRALNRYDLVQRPCKDNTRIYKDVIIFRSEHKLSSLDSSFITALCESRRRYIK